MLTNYFHMDKEKIIKSFYDKATIISFIAIWAFVLIIIETIFQYGPGAAEMGFPFIYRSIIYIGGKDPSGIFNIVPFILNLISYYVVAVVISFLYKLKK